MSKKTEKRISTSSMIGIVFVILKLTGNITWPWIWVLSPFWIYIVFWLVFLGGIGALIVFLAVIFKKK